MRHWTASIFAATASLAAIAATADAATIPITMVTPTVLLADFNVIAEEDLTTSTDIQGPVMVGCLASGCVSTEGLLATGGPLNSKSVVLGTTAGTTGITGYGEVDVFGNVLAGTNVSVMGSVTYIGGTNGGSLLTSGTGSVLGGYAFPPGTAAQNATTFQTYIWNPLTTLSSNLAALSPNSMFSGNTFTPGMTVTATNAAVFNIDLSALTTAGNLTFAGCLSSSDPATRCNAVINVIGSGTLDNTHLVFPAGLTGIGNFPNIIVNFEDGVTDVVENVWTASILDPLGSVTGKHEIDGGVVAENFSTSDETHLPGFDCSSNLCGPSNIIITPEPGSLTVLGAAFASFAALTLLRRRRA